MICLGAAGCIKSKGPKRLATATPISVAYLVQTPGGWSAAVPARFVDAQQKALADRNLTPQRVDASSLVGASLTNARLASMAASSSSGIIALVEASTRYDSVLAGRYRWTVFAKVTVADRNDTRRSVTRSFTVPVILEYDHEEASDALVDAAASVSTELGKVVDSYVASYGTGGGAPGSAPNQAPAAASAANAIYMILVDRFANGDPKNDHAVDRADPQAWHGGDLAGVTAKLDYVKSLGFDTVWLSPITDARRDKFGGHGAYHGYWTTELGELNPIFGDAEALESLRAGAEARDIKLVFDLVLNHVGPGAPLAAERPGWFHRRGRITDWSDPVQVTEGDVHGLPDLDQDNPEVYAYLLGRAAGWVERARPAGFRMDAVRHVEPRFWRRFLPELRERAGRPLAMIGEVFDGNPAAIAGGFELGFDQLFDFPLYYAATQALCDGAPLSSLGAALASDRSYANPAGLITFADNHDLPRIASRCPAPSARQALLSFLLSIRGTPSITYGTEVGLAGAEEPANRGDMRFGELDATGELIRELLERRRAHPSLRGVRREFLEAGEDRLVWRQSGGGEIAHITLARGDRPELAVSFEPGELPAPALVEIRWIGRGAPEGRPALVGNVGELGLWSTPHTAPSVRLPAGELVAFKLAVVRPDGSVEIEGGENRTLLVREPTELELSWQK